MTTRANLYVDQGTSFSVTLDLTTGDGDAVNLSDQTFFCGVKKLYSSSTLFTANVSINASAPLNDITLTIQSDQTRDLEPGKYQYDVLMLNNGSVSKLLEGLIFIIPTVTMIPE
jgi:hypothetical protein